MRNLFNYFSLYDLDVREPDSSHRQSSTRVTNCIKPAQADLPEGGYGSRSIRLSAERPSMGTERRRTRMTKRNIQHSSRPYSRPGSSRRKKGIRELHSIWKPSCVPLWAVQAAEMGVTNVPYITHGHRYSGSVPASDCRRWLVCVACRSIHALPCQVVVLDKVGPW